MLQKFGMERITKMTNEELKEIIKDHDKDIEFVCERARAARSKNNFIEEDRQMRQLSVLISAQEFYKSFLKE